MPSAFAEAARLDGVSKRYGKIVALRSIDLVLDRGRTTVLLGPNGAGKTTCVKLLLGLTRPDSGSATVFGADPRLLSTRSRVGAMLQVSKVPETLRVREHIDVFRSYYPNPLSRDVLLTAAGLEALGDRLYGTLSGGERQRVLFALALCGDPDLLFLDEPTVGLDVETRRSLWQRIRTLRDDGRAILLTTHYLDEADALADRVVIIDQGAVIADGSPQELKAHAGEGRLEDAYLALKNLAYEASKI